jgi:predicted DNA-binding protein (UPF0251 family)
MGFTEIVYKIRSEGFPLCAFTAANPDVKVVVNQTSWDVQARSGRALYTLMGPEDKLRALAQLAAPLFDESNATPTGKDQMVLHTVSKLDTMRRSGNPMAFALEYFGDGAVLEPALVREGYYHTRLLLTQRVDLADLLQAYEKGAKDGRWSDFKLIRIDDFDPETQVAGAFTESLTQKQLEVIKTALALGFYNTPRDITLDDLSNIFGISKAAVHNRLQAAERKVIAKFFA